MAKELTKEQMELEEKRLELEERKQALESKKVADELARIQLAEKKQELDTKLNAKRRGKEDAEQAIRERAHVQAICNHHTGGEGGIAIMNGQGDTDRPTCIGGIQFLDDSIELTCNRCFKKWNSAYPNGSAEKNYGPWQEGVNLWKKSVNKQIAIVGGPKKTRVTQIPA